MKAIKSLSSLFYVAILALLISAATSFNPYATFTFLFVASFFMPKSVAFMAVTKEIWTKDIINNLFKDNAFALRAFNADIYVLLGKVVHIATAGAPSQVVKNLTNFPATATKRADGEVTYAIDTFYSMPRHIEKIEQYELEYDKRQSVLGEDQANLIQTAIDSLLYRWSPAAANVIATDGGAVPATLSGATGNRKSFTKSAFKTLKLKLDKANILAAGRIALLTADHYAQFLESLSDPERVDVGRVSDLATGKVGQYLGFEIYMRSSVSRYRGANIGAVAVVDEQDQAYAATVDDRAASIFYQEQCVERAKGAVELYSGEDRPEYYGSIYSMSLRLGGRIRRAAGVWAVVEELTA
jgi:hypothetical protein